MKALEAKEASALYENKNEDIPKQQHKI